MKRKKYSSQLKSKVALAALKAQRTDMVNIVKRKRISPVAILSMKQNSLKFLSVHSQRRSHLVSTVDHSDMLGLVTV